MLFLNFQYTVGYITSSNAIYCLYAHCKVLFENVFVEIVDAASQVELRCVPLIP